MSLDSDSAQQLIKKFHLLQEERAHAYKLFEEGHKIYLDSAPNYDFLKFRQLVNDLTIEFKRISQSMIVIENQLRFGGRPKLADIVLKLQDCEKRKLELSAKLQIAKQEAVDNPDSAEKKNEVVDINLKLRDVQKSVDQQVIDLKWQMDGIITK